jgi:phosphatidylglycerophosphate synthase
MPSTLVGTPDALRQVLTPDAPDQVFEIQGSPVLRMRDLTSFSQELLTDPAAWIQQQNVCKAPVDGLFQNVTDKASSRMAERALIQSLRKSVDGLISRTLNRPLSLLTTRLLARTPITPNQWTVFIGVVGLVGAWMLAQGGYWMMTLGALTVHISSILDGCDGELARIKFQSSQIGEWLDTAFDDVVNSAMILGLGLGMHATTGESLYATTAILAYVMYLTATSFIYFELATKYRSGYALDFTWWFEEANEHANTSEGRGGFFDTIKLCMRRDFYILFFLVLIAATVPQVAFWCAFTAIAALLTIALAHQLRS